MRETIWCKKLFETSLQAGQLALSMQKDIVNEGKEIVREEMEDDLHYAMRQAKTKADVMVQDLLLQAMMADKDIFTLDVEEESEYVGKYACHDEKYTLVIDPIDGTLQYLNQQDTYSICSAILHQSDIITAVVYFPKRDMLYCYEPKYGARYFVNASQCDFLDGQEINMEYDLVNRIYKNDRVPEPFWQALNNLGYEIIDDRKCCCPDALLACMQKEAFAYISHTRNIRDILVGAILSKCKDGAVLDLDGNNVKWPAKGRLPFGIFTRFPDEMREILRKIEKK